MFFVWAYVQFGTCICDIASLLTVAAVAPCTNNGISIGITVIFFCLVKVLRISSTQLLPMVILATLSSNHHSYCYHRRRQQQSSQVHHSSWPSLPLPCPCTKRTFLCFQVRLDLRPVRLCSGNSNRNSDSNSNGDGNDAASAAGTSEDSNDIDE